MDSQLQYHEPLHQSQARGASPQQERQQQWDERNTVDVHKYLYVLASEAEEANFPLLVSSLSQFTMLLPARFELHNFLPNLDSRDWWMSAARTFHLPEKWMSTSTEVFGFGATTCIVFYSTHNDCSFCSAGKLSMVITVKAARTSLGIDGAVALPH